MFSSLDPDVYCILKGVQGWRDGSTGYKDGLHFWRIRVRVPAPHAPGVVVHLETGGSEVQDYLQLHSKLEAS